MLHDLRVNLRRLQAAAHVLDKLMHSPLSAPIKEAASHVLKASNPLRNEHVMASLFKSGRYQRWLGQRAVEMSQIEPPLYRAINNNLDARFFDFTRTLLLTPITLLPEASYIPAAIKLIRKDTQRLRRRAAKLQSHSNDSAYLHHFRVRAKRLRYSIALLQTVLPEDTQQLAKMLKKTQDIFGQLHDVEMVEEILHAEKYPRRKLIAKVDKRRSTLKRKALRAGKKLEKRLYF